MAELPNFGFHPVWTEIKEYLARFDTAAMTKKRAVAGAPKVDLVE